MDDKQQSADEKQDASQDDTEGQAFRGRGREEQDEAGTDAEGQMFRGRGRDEQGEPGEDEGDTEGHRFHGSDARLKREVRPLA